MVSELRIRNVLVVQVSPHCRNAVKEAELARRILFAAREDGSLPQGYDPGLLCLRDRRPFPDSPAEIAETAAAVADPNYRIEAAEDGLHVYNRDGHHIAARPVRPLSRSSGVEAGWRPRLLSRRRAGPGPDRPPARQALRPGQELGWGVRGRAAEPRTNAHFVAAGSTLEAATGRQAGLMPFIRESIVTTLERRRHGPHRPAGRDRGAALAGASPRSSPRRRWATCAGTPSPASATRPTCASSPAA